MTSENGGGACSDAGVSVCLVLRGLRGFVIFAGGIARGTGAKRFDT
jgi:hypothetical protein